MITDIPVDTLLVLALVGAIAGWLSGAIVKGRGFGLIGDIVVGIIGAFVGGWLLPRFGRSSRRRPCTCDRQRDDRICRLVAYRSTHSTRVTLAGGDVE